MMVFISKGKSSRERFVGRVARCDVDRAFTTLLAFRSEFELVFCFLLLLVVWC